MRQLARGTQETGILVLLALSAYAQLRIDTGELTGTVRREDNSPLANARVLVRDAERGIAQSTLTGSDGVYRIALLPPDTYLVEVAAPGYVVESFRDVQIHVGESVRLDVALGFAGGNFQTTVEANALPIDFTRTHQATTLTSGQLENLPINQRNYLNFALLTPGVSESETVANAFDFREPVAPTSGMSFAGSNGRGNTFSIDGIENNANTGSVRLSVPQAAVQEFQVNRNGYPAEYGGAYGGALNIVTKSGSNQFHGDVFGFLRQRELQARNYFDPAKSAYTREQSGIGVGGPVRKDRLYYYAAFERLDRHESAFVPLLSDPSFLSGLTPGQQQIVSTLTATGDPQLGGIAAAMRGLLTPSSNPAVPALFAANSGVFPFHEAGSMGSLRLDAPLGGDRTLFFRLNGAGSDVQNSRSGAQYGFTRGNTASITGGTAMVSYSQRWNPHWTSVTRLAFAYEGMRLEPIDPYGPAIDISGFGSFGRDQIYPYQKYERHIQIQQAFDYFRGRHSLKFGVDLDPVRGNGRLDSSMAGDFVFGEFIPLSALLAGVDPNLPAAMAAVLESVGGPALAARLGEPINSLQAYALGLPVAYVQGFGDGNVAASWQQHVSAFVEEGYRVNPSLTLNAGLRFQYDATARFPEQHFFDPRFGFAWSPRNSSKLVVRGGYGLYHGWIDSQIVYLANAFLPPLSVNLLFVPITGLPGVINPATGLPLTSVDVYQSLLARGILGRRQIQFSDLTPLGIRPGFQFPAGGGLDPGYRSPGSQQASLQVERSIGNLVVSAGYDFVRVAHLPRLRDHNLYEAGKRPDGSPIFGRFDPSLLTDFVVEGSGNAFYNALVLAANKRFGRRWAVNAQYTFSKAIDDVSDFDANFAPANQLDARGDRGLSTFHQQHRFTTNAVYETASGWTFAPIVSANSFRPFNVLTGYDNLGDGQVYTHRPWGLGRNVGIGPDYFSVDARVARRVRLGRDSPTYIQFVAEVFNMLNRTNFGAVNNIVGATPVAALPDPLTGRRGDPVTPLSFTSAKAPRQFQFGVRLGF
jgi:hypothetical protein